MTVSRGRRGSAATPLFAALLDPACYPHPVKKVQVIETHISWVLLTGTYAYKIKKPVNLGFADFTTLGLRRHYCEQEVRLNARLAPDLYLDVVTIRGDAAAPRIGGEGRVLDYAVRMREFPQAALARRALEAGAFGAAEVDALAARVAAFHAGIPAARANAKLGTPAAIQTAALQNFEQMLPLARLAADDRILRDLRLWSEREFGAHREAFAGRLRGGFVRECHGDLHLGNIVLLDGQPVPFDCIEFNDEFRWIDVLNEAAFLVMDLEDRGRGDLGWRFLNRYLEITGDYAGIEVLRYYLVYRALVRAKVHLLRSRQPRLRRVERSRLVYAFHDYQRLAVRYANPGRPLLLLTHGLSGCGKTTATGPLIEQLGAVRLRSDVERRRVHGVAASGSSGSGLDTGLYTPEATATTYRRLETLADAILGARFSVVVDAAFLRRDERAAFRAIAERHGAPFLILDFLAPLEVLRSRIAARQAQGCDASEADLAVLERQVERREPLTPAESAVAVPVDGTRPATRETWLPVVEELRRATG